MKIQHELQKNAPLNQTDNILHIHLFRRILLLTHAQNSSGQSEFNTYAPGGPLEMVDLSTGNFRLNLPVFRLLIVPGAATN
ncbi:hypothetical protein [Hymenobacter weizhouensis]|uniref:hypothetical protein n=1 Tax=Hymenobacter sp. YIM 151500-1 TaxID=2987689 RepID=UPI00222763E7|nr:hypothetical protein [Hymenobacter sp. YIM 151500-1]UYZ62538.1 hypothetical protein OIS53_16250 [Hymenobacter sp. YIM 151500-1]